MHCWRPVSKRCLSFLSWIVVNVFALDVTVNVALLRPAVQVSTKSAYVASRAVDGDLNTESCTQARSITSPWLSIDLGTPMNVGRVCVTNDDNPNYGKLRQILRPYNNKPNIPSRAIAFTGIKCKKTYQFTTLCKSDRFTHPKQQKSFY